MIHSEKQQDLANSYDPVPREYIHAAVTELKWRQFTNGFTMGVGFAALVMIVALLVSRWLHG
jgi:hypothetical protein